MKLIKEKVVAELIQETETVLNWAIAEWQMIPHSQFARKPSVEAWSANECVQHLTSYGRYYLPAIEQALKLKILSDEKFFSPGWLGNYFTNLMRPKAEGKISKMKSPKDHAPQKIVESHLVIVQFIDQQETLLRLLQQSKNADWEKMRVPISLTKMIRLKLGDVFRFYVAHQQRHFQQVERALAMAKESSEAAL